MLASCPAILAKSGQVLLGLFLAGDTSWATWGPRHGVITSPAAADGRDGASDGGQHHTRSRGSCLTDAGDARTDTVIRPDLGSRWASDTVIPPNFALYL